MPSLSIYTTFFYNGFAAGIQWSSMVLVNGTLLFWPPIRAEISSISRWTTDNKRRGQACLAGVVASLGEGIQLMGGTRTAASALSYKAGAHES